jgi:hypothetical protein
MAVSRERYFLGLDLGQAQDFSALAVVRQVPQEAEPRYEVAGLKRWELGTPYPAIVEGVAGILAKPPLLAAHTSLIVDQTGVGAPVVDSFEVAGLRPLPLLITAGSQVVSDGAGWHVPKRDLVSVLQVLLQGERLKIAAALPHAGTLRTELLNFKVKVTLAGNDTYGAGSEWREGMHDDLVLALALACWVGERGQSPAGFSLLGPDRRDPGYLTAVGAR